MKVTKAKKNPIPQQNKSVLFFYRYDSKYHEGENIDNLGDVREVGKAMAKKVAKKLALRLDV